MLYVSSLKIHDIECVTNFNNLHYFATRERYTCIPNIIRLLYK